MRRKIIRAPLRPTGRRSRPTLRSRAFTNGTWNSWRKRHTRRAREGTHRRDRRKRGRRGHVRLARQRYQKQGAWQKAIDITRRRLQFDPRNIAILTALAHCQAKSGNVKRGRDFLRAGRCHERTRRLSESPTALAISNRPVLFKVFFYTMAIRLAVLFCFRIQFAGGPCIVNRLVVHGNGLLVGNHGLVDVAAFCLAVRQRGEDGDVPRVETAAPSGTCRLPSAMHPVSGTRCRASRTWPRRPRLRDRAGECLHELFGCAFLRHEFHVPFVKAP